MFPARHTQIPGHWPNSSNRLQISVEEVLITNSVSHLGLKATALQYCLCKDQSSQQPGSDASKGRISLAGIGGLGEFCHQLKCSRTLQPSMLRISDVLVNGDDLSLTPALTVLVGSGGQAFKGLFAYFSTKNASCSQHSKGGSFRTVPLCCPSNTEQIIFLLPGNPLLSLLEPLAQGFSHSFPSPLDSLEL